VQAGITEIRALYVNDLDRGPFISDTLRIDPTKNRMEALSNLPHDAPGRAAHARRGGEPVPEPLLQPERYDLSGVGRMKFNRRVGRTEVKGPGILYDALHFAAAATISRRP